MLVPSTRDMQTPGARVTSTKPSDSPPTHWSESGFGTRAIHAGQEPDPSTGAIMTPVYLTSTYVQEAPGKNKGYDYSRTINPTRVALERNLAALEGARHGLCFSSGMGAINTVLNLLSAGDHVVAGNDLYGGTYRIFTTLYARFGVQFTFVDTTDLATVRSALTDRTRLLFVETPSNPLLRIRH
jgi:cystathionine beta-lyase/cystathionine gamma-synthase